MRFPFTKRFQSFRGDDSGATAIESAILFPLFFALSFTFFDMGAVMLRQITLNSAIDKVSRELRISGTLGTAPNASATELMDEYRRQVCERTFILNDCVNNLIVDMRPLTSTAAFPPARAPCAEQGPGGRAAPVTQYNQNATTEVFLVRVCAPSSQLMPGYGIGNYLSDSYGEIMIFSATAFLFET